MYKVMILIRNYLSKDFYQPGAHKACTQLVLRLLYFPAFVCVSVCSSAIIMYAKYVILLLCHNSHERSGSYWKFAGSIGQDTLVLCCLDGERDDNSVLANSDR